MRELYWNFSLYVFHYFNQVTESLHTCWTIQQQHLQKNKDCDS